MSWYTANLVPVLPPGNLSYIVYANKRPGQPNACRLDEHREIVRCWTRGFFSVFLLVNQIAKSKPDLIHVQHEVFLLGKGLSAILWPFLFIAIKLMRIPVVVTVHGVPPLSEINKPFTKSYGIHLPPFLLKAALWSLMWPIARLADRIVVHRGDFVEVLTEEYLFPKRKMIVIPLGIEAGEGKIDSTEAKTRLGLQGKQIILFFGYLTAYKGIELLIDTMSHLEKSHPNLVLLIAGGETPGLKVAGRESYLECLKQRAKNASVNIHFTGFVDNQDIALYYSAADLVVLPYPVRMSSSGPLSLALAYERPYIVSTTLASVVELKAAMFEPTVPSLTEKIDQFLKNADLQRDISDYGLKLKAERSWRRIGEQTSHLYSALLSGARFER